MVLKKIFLTGGTGKLGTELIKKSRDFGIEFVSPSSSECDIRDLNSVLSNISNSECDVVLHSAALTDVKAIELDSIPACDVNIIGTLNIIKACLRFNKKLIFISTDYVFDGKVGQYKTSDPINPISKYAKTKAAAELMGRTIDTSLIIRTSFFGHNFPYDKAVADQWSTKDYVDVIAPLILKHLGGNNSGIVHIGTERDTTYNKAIRRKSTVEKIFLKDIDFKIPKDVSLFLG